MPIIFRCQECDARLTARNSGAGRQIRCPGCGSVEEVPEPGAKGKSRSGRSGESRNRPGSHETRTRSERGRSRPASRTQRTAPAESQGSSRVLISSLIGGGLLLVGAVGFVAYKMGQSEPEITHNQEVAAAEKSNPAGETPLVSQTNPAPAASPVKNTPLASGGAINNLQTAPINNQQTRFFKNSNTEPAPTPEPEPTPPATPVASTPVSNPPEILAPASARPVLSVADLNEQIEPSVVRIDVISREGSGNGSGYVVDAGGLIATNYHVIEGGSRATVVFSDGTSTPVVGLVALVPRKDIAILKINLPSRKLKPIPLATALPRKGEDTVAFGAPLGLSFSMSEGIVSGIRKSDELRDIKLVDVDGTWLQTTTPISPGNSGGPLVNRRGELVAMNTMTLAYGQNLNFAISSLDIAEALKKKTDRLIALTPQNTAPVSKSLGREREKLIDATNTKKGEELLSQLKQVVLLRIEIGFNDVTGNVNDFLKLQAERALERAGIKMLKDPRNVQDPALMVLGLNFEDKDGANTAAGTQELEMVILLLWHGTDENGQPQVYKLYEAKEKVGTFAQASLQRGIIPRRVQEDVSSVFRKYSGKFRKAQRDHGR